MDGIINLNKPRGISSARAVSMIKRVLSRGVKVGHAGTLDPFATGVLLILVGKSTKSCENLMSQPKGYRAVIKLGATTATFDPESAEIPAVDPVVPDRAAVEAALRQMVGVISQRPPIFSALKIAGQEAYKLARAGKEVKLEPRLVTIYSIELLNYDWPFVTVQVECGRGTYIRAIARDLGEALGTGGYLTELSRTHVGEFDLAQAHTIEEVRNLGPESCLTHFPGVAERD